MRIRLITLTICSLLFLFGASAAYSCSCSYPEVFERLKSSDIVFLGEVSDIEPVSTKDKAKDEMWAIESVATLKIEKQWKGKKASNITVFWGANFFAKDCGELSLVKGEKYLVFSNRKIKGRYIVHQECSWSSLAKDSQDDIKKLDLKSN